jgi:hypothetical protein
LKHVSRLDNHPTTYTKSKIMKEVKNFYDECTQKVSLNRLMNDAGMVSLSELQPYNLSYDEFLTYFATQ